ncbi:MAG: hypothetical protein JWO67_7193 [Streptosporangiaceae bacterium]|nr:hypothetical protein [Streptosporangiaceae bacterium]
MSYPVYVKDGVELMAGSVSEEVRLRWSGWRLKQQPTPEVPADGAPEVPSDGAPATPDPVKRTAKPKPKSTDTE